MFDYLARKYCREAINIEELARFALTEAGGLRLGDLFNLIDNTMSGIEKTAPEYSTLLPTLEWNLSLLKHLRDYRINEIQGITIPDIENNEAVVLYLKLKKPYLAKQQKQQKEQARKARIAELNKKVEETSQEVNEKETEIKNYQEELKNLEKQGGKNAKK